MKNLLLSALLLSASLLQAQPLQLGQADTISLGPDLQLIRLSPHAYLHVCYAEMSNGYRYGSNGLVWVSGDRAWLFDTPVNDSLTLVLYRFISDSLHARLQAVVPNHWHFDCMGGLAALHRLGVDSYAYRGTVDAAIRNGLPVPHHAFSDSLVLAVPEGRIVCWHPGPAHTADNIVVWIPMEKILFAGCMAKEVRARNLGNLADGDPKHYADTIRRVMMTYPDARIVIPGHGQPGGRDVLVHTLELAMALQQG